MEEIQNQELVLEYINEIDEIQKQRIELQKSIREIENNCAQVYRDKVNYQQKTEILLAGIKKNGENNDINKEFVDVAEESIRIIMGINSDQSHEYEETELFKKELVSIHDHIKSLSHSVREKREKLITKIKSYQDKKTKYTKVIAEFEAKEKIENQQINHIKSKLRHRHENIENQIDKAIQAHPIISKLELQLAKINEENSLLTMKINELKNPDTSQVEKLMKKNLKMRKRLKIC